MYGNSHCKSYSTDHVAVGYLIREIRDTHSVIPHFTQCELDFIVSPPCNLNTLITLRLSLFFCTFTGVFQQQQQQ